MEDGQDRVASGLKWISESDALPRIGQLVLTASPRQTGEFWDLRTARLLARHEGVLPLPVKAGDRWPTDYYWGRDHWNKDTALVTGNGWWASMAGIALPPGAEHRKGPIGDDYVAQLGEQFIPQARPA